MPMCPKIGRFHGKRGGEVLKEMLIPLIILQQSIYNPDCTIKSRPPLSANAFSMKKQNGTCRLNLAFLMVEGDSFEINA